VVVSIEDLLLIKMAEDLLDNPIAFLSETFLLLYGKSMRFLKRQNAGDIENDIK
jgi:hypothetical protein